MLKISRRGVFLVVIVFVIAYLSFFLLEYGASGSVPEENRGMIVRDELKPGEHHLSGLIQLPSACDSFSIQTTELDAFRYHLSFETWREPQRDCENTPVARPFNTVVFAPAFGVFLTADLDGVALPFTLIPSIIN